MAVIRTLVWQSSEQQYDRSDQDTGRAVRGIQYECDYDTGMGCSDDQETGMEQGGDHEIAPPPKKKQ